eukprot:8800137-Pyramimonas_sp.AAC.1
MRVTVVAGQEEDGVLVRMQAKGRRTVEPVPMFTQSGVTHPEGVRHEESRPPDALSTESVR